MTSYVKFCRELFFIALKFFVPLYVDVLKFKRNNYSEWTEIRFEIGNKQTISI